MPCPTCDCVDFTPVLLPPDRRVRGPSLAARLGAFFRALVGRGADSSAQRQCLRCGRIYAAGPARPRDAEDEEEDRIAERLSRIESQMSGFGASVLPSNLAPLVTEGLEIRPKYEVKCGRCGHFDFVEPSPNAACAKCGRLFEKVEEALKDQKGPTHKSVSV